LAREGSNAGGQAVVTSGGDKSIESLFHRRKGSVRIWWSRGQKIVRFHRRL